MGSICWLVHALLKGRNKHVLLPSTLVKELSSIPMDPGMNQPHLGGPHAGLGMVTTEDYSVPDRMVGLSKFATQKTM